MPGAPRTEDETATLLAIPDYYTRLQELQGPDGGGTLRQAPQRRSWTQWLRQE